MTPERKKYLAKCSEKEKMLRRRIEVRKDFIVSNKFKLNNNKRLEKCERDWYLMQIKDHKFNLTLYRHELHRLKGMDSVVVPKRAEGYIGVFVCSCGSDVIANYCPNCGRRILWEKVK